MAKLEEILVVFVEPPEEGEAVLVPDFPLEHHNASLKVAAHPVWCLPPMQVVEDQEMLGAIQDGQLGPFGGSWVEGLLWTPWLLVQCFHAHLVAGPSASLTGGSFGHLRDPCQPGLRCAANKPVLGQDLHGC
jgi:hypothetical protein